MKILILTSTPHVEFIESQIRKNTSPEYNLIIGTQSNMDFFSDYDIGISFMSLVKVPKEQLSKTWINFHPGPLPKYKGRNLCYHALMNDEKYFGATIHYMDEDFDTGDIIEVSLFPIFGFDTAQSLSDMALQTSQEQFVEYLPRIIAGEQFERHTNLGGTYYKKEPINEILDIPDYLKREIRAITYGQFYPKIDIGGDIYKVVKE